MKFVHIDEQKKIGYREYGSNNADVMVLIHGIAETSLYFWDNLLSHIQDRYHIIIIDLLGHGDSSKPLNGYDWQTQRDIVLEIINQLSLSDVILIGHSIGGIISAEVAIQQPSSIKKLILYDTPIPQGWLSNLRFAFRSLPLNALIAIGPLVLPGIGLLATLLPMRFLVNFTLTQWRVPINPVNRTSTLLDQAERTVAYALAGYVRNTFFLNNTLLESINVPTLLIVGEYDVLVPIHKVESDVVRIPQSKMQIVGQAGHLALIDNPEEFLKQLDMFLKL